MKQITRISHEWVITLVLLMFLLAGCGRQDPTKQGAEKRKGIWSCRNSTAPILVERSGLNDNHQPGPTSSLDSGLRIDVDKVLGWVAAGLFALSLFLPAVNLDPWLPGFNLLMLSFLGTVFFGFVAVVEGAKNGDLPLVLGNFTTCFLGAAANVLMISTLFRISRGRRVPVTITALTLALTLAAAGALCYRSDLGVEETLSFGYFAWAGCAGLLVAALLAQPPRR